MNSITIPMKVGDKVVFITIEQKDDAIQKAKETLVTGEPVAAPENVRTYEQAASPILWRQNMFNII